MKKRITACIMIVAVLLSVLPSGTLAAGRYGNMPIYLGYYDVDYMADEILKEIPTAGKSHTEQIRAVYDWIITHCTRYENEWDGVYHFSDEAIEAVKDSYIEKLNSEIYSGRSGHSRGFRGAFRNAVVFQCRQPIFGRRLTRMIL